MLGRLLLYRIISSDDEQSQVHPGGTGKHLADKLFMPRYIDDTHPKRWQVQMGVTQLNSDPAFLFFRKPIGVGAR